MADVTVSVPPPKDITIASGANLYIDAGDNGKLCCSIGDNFTPSIKDIRLVKNTTMGPYQAGTAATGTYDTSGAEETCRPSGGTTLNAKSIQIT